MAINLQLTELATCGCDKGKLLPLEDVTQGGVTYLKGWYCPVCGVATIFKAGDLVRIKASEVLQGRNS